MKKLFQLSFVIAVFFIVVGSLLFVYSFITSGDKEAVTVNRWCGIVFIVFSLVMFFLSSKENNAKQLEKDS
jgi:uncharacterized membrane protein